MCVLQVDRIAGVFESDTSQHDLNTGDYSAEDRSIHILIPRETLSTYVLSNSPLDLEKDVGGLAISS